MSFSEYEFVVSGRIVGTSSVATGDGECMCVYERRFSSVDILGGAFDSKSESFHMNLHMSVCWWTTIKRINQSDRMLIGRTFNTRKEHNFCLFFCFFSFNLVNFILNSKFGKMFGKNQMNVSITTAYLNQIHLKIEQNIRKASAHTSTSPQMIVIGSTKV